MKPSLLLLAAAVSIVAPAASRAGMGTGIGWVSFFAVYARTVSVTFLAMILDGLQPTDEIVRSLPVDVTYDISRETHELVHWNYHR